MSRTHRPHSAGACVICVTHPQNEGLSRSGPGRKVLTMGVLRDTVGNFTICRITVEKSVHPLLDAEMVKAIANMPKWNPGTQRGKPVRVKYSVPVNGNDELAIRLLIGPYFCNFVTHQEYHRTCVSKNTPAPLSCKKGRPEATFFV